MANIPAVGGKSASGNRQHISTEEREKRNRVIGEISNNSNDLKCPPYLNKRAKKVWKHLVSLYKEAKLQYLNDLDQNMLANFCTAAAIWQEDNDLLKQFLGDPDNQIKSLKEFIAIQKAMNEQVKTMSTCADKLALTPLGRARLGIAISNQDEGGDKLNRFMEDLVSGGGGDSDL